jgi:hypothetical protein
VDGTLNLAILLRIVGVRKTKNGVVSLKEGV